MTILVIVESPGKIKKIKSFLGNGYIVAASVGHIRDLAKKSLSIDVNNHFEPTYEIMTDKLKVVSGLKKLAKNADKILIASDGDREGEAIAYHLITVLKLDDSNYDRIVFHEITKSAINNALKVPKKIDMNMFYSQQTRRLLDRIVGFKLSPILKSIPDITTNSLGAGRVQSVVTRMIVDKENDIKLFLQSDNFSTYNIIGDFVINNINFKSSYIYFDSKTFEKRKIEITTKEQVKVIATKIFKHPTFKIVHITNNERQRHPPQPFTTSTLQQEAAYKLHLPIKQTMMIAQKLYEKGHITYMRTDSPTLSNEALNLIKKQILEDRNLGEEYYQFRQFKSKNENSQEAHEAIRPSHIDVVDLNDIDNIEKKLYDLIWKRTVASQMKPAKYQDQHIILGNEKEICFEGTNSILLFDGYLKLYGLNEIADENDIVIKLNCKKLDDNIVDWNKIHFKEAFLCPPTRYNEPSLVKQLEELSIGRPSTYAAIISKIQEHKYVKFDSCSGVEKNISIYTLTHEKLTKEDSIQIIGSDKEKLVPTTDGLLVTNYLINNFPQIMDYKFTAHMEQLLDEIADGKKIWYDVLQEYYDILKTQFKNNLSIDIDKKFIIRKINKSHDNSHVEHTKLKENKIIGKHPQYGNIEYLHAKYGPVFKVMNNKKTIFVSAKDIDENDIKTAIERINYKVSTCTNKK